VALHRLRVRVKRLRYACETLAGLAQDGLETVIARLIALQDVLGEHQDASTQASWLREQAPAAALAPSTLVATGAVVHALERRAAGSAAASRAPGSASTAGGSAA